MSDLSITAANVAAGTAAVTVDGTAGATITAGQCVYLDSTTSTYKLCDADSATAAVRAPAGVSLNGASSGQPIKIQTGGNINPGATVVVGQIYVPSATAGGIAPVTDLTTGWYTSILGVATTTSNIKLAINPAVALHA